jgi:hypothetical protein
MKLNAIHEAVEKKLQGVASLHSVHDRPPAKLPGLLGGRHTHPTLSSEGRGCCQQTTLLRYEQRSGNGAQLLAQLRTRP